MPDETADESFGKALRLRRRGEFLRVQKQGRRVPGRYLLVLIAEAVRPGPSRVGVTVSSKVGNSVVRNRLKRWLREHLRRHKASWPSGDVVIVAREVAATATHPVIDAELATLFARARAR